MLIDEHSKLYRIFQWNTLSYFSVQCMQIQHKLLCVCLTHSPLTMRTQSTHILRTYTNVRTYAISNGMYYTFQWNTLGEFADSPLVSDHWLGFSFHWVVNYFTFQHHQLLSVKSNTHSSTYTILHYIILFYFQIFHKGFSLKIYLISTKTS